MVVFCVLQAEVSSVARGTKKIRIKKSNFEKFRFFNLYNLQGLPWGSSNIYIYRVRKQSVIFGAWCKIVPFLWKSHFFDTPCIYTSEELYYVDIFTRAIHTCVIVNQCTVNVIFLLQFYICNFRFYIPPPLYQFFSCALVFMWVYVRFEKWKMSDCKRIKYL